MSRARCRSSIDVTQAGANLLGRRAGASGAHAAEIRGTLSVHLAHALDGTVIGLRAKKPGDGVVSRVIRAHRSGTRTTASRSPCPTRTLAVASFTLLALVTGR